MAGEFPPTATTTLPVDGYAGALVGRVWDPEVGGPSVVAVRPDGLHDLSSTFATTADLFELPDPAAALAASEGPVLCSLDDALVAEPGGSRPRLLSPIDVQVVKAAGVTFAVSMIERVLEERAGGDAGLADRLRAEIADRLGAELATIRPGSGEAERLKEYLVAQGMWSQYLEVGIGPDAEIFTKAPVLSSVGTADDVGVLAASRWNNPEPEVVLVVASHGGIVGATLGNDVNLRDVEGRSALLLGKAKDNNASAAIGPFVRLFDEGFRPDDLHAQTVTLRVTGDDGFVLDGASPLSAISRSPEELVAQLRGAHHQYPDGAGLFLGTMFAPVADRDEVGRGFTHHAGDIVEIAAPALGTLVNRVRASEDCRPWEFGIRALFANLAERGLV